MGFSLLPIFDFGLGYIAHWAPKSTTWLHESPFQ
jgi:hypothetical protein